MSLGWKIGGGLLLAAAFAFLVYLYGGAQRRAGKTEGTSAERTLWQDRVIEAERGKLIAYQAGVRAVEQADGRYIETIRERVVPLVRTITERTTEYAATPAGAALCLAPDRVRWLEETKRTLFPATAPGPTPGAADPVPPDLVVDEPGRVTE